MKLQYKIHCLDKTIEQYADQYLKGFPFTIDNTYKQTKRILDKHGQVMALCKIVSTSIIICPKNDYCELLPWKQYNII